MNNNERFNNLKLFSNGMSLKGGSVRHHILEDYINKTEAMAQEKIRKKKEKEKSSGKHKL